MQTKANAQARALVTGLFNSVLAGRPASDAFGDALCHEWLPAMAAALGQAGEDADMISMRARRLLVRLGWLLEHLPRAQSIHTDLLARAIREYRADFRAFVPAMFAESATQLRHRELLDRELLDGLEVTAEGQAFRPRTLRIPMAPIAALRSTPSQVHPHDRGMSGVWKAVMLESRDRRRDEQQAMDTLTRIARLREGDRVEVTHPDGSRETWRVLRNVAASQNVLFENESTRRQGVLGVRVLASQYDAGRVAILG